MRLRGAHVFDGRRQASESRFRGGQRPRHLRRLRAQGPGPPGHQEHRGDPERGTAERDRPDPPRGIGIRRATLRGAEQVDPDHRSPARRRASPRRDAGRRRKVGRVAAGPFDATDRHPPEGIEPFQGRIEAPGQRGGESGAPRGAATQHDAIDPAGGPSRREEVEGLLDFEQQVPGDLPQRRLDVLETRTPGRKPLLELLGLVERQTARVAERVGAGVPRAATSV